MDKLRNSQLALRATIAVLLLSGCGTLEIGIEGPTPTQPAASPTTPAADPTASPTQPPTISDLVQPLLIDGERGWIFASGSVDGEPQTVKLATEDGRLLAAYDPVGRLALDRGSNRLFVDQGEAGIAILDAGTGELQATITLPTADPPTADPQVDPQSGRAYVFRDRTAYLLDGASAGIMETKIFNITASVCGAPGEDAPISDSFYDLVNNRLYLVFVTYVCTPWVTHTFIAHDGATLAELGRYETGREYQAVPYSDSLYGSTASQAGRNVSWAWNSSQAWFEEGDEARDLQGIVADWGRGLIYEALGDQIWAFTAYPRQLVERSDVELLEVGGRLVGHDPISDQLYFLVDGRLGVYPTTSVLGE